MGHPPFPDATFEVVEKTLNSAHSCFLQFSKKKAEQRADFLRRIADNLENNRNLIVETAEQETSLGYDRLQGECSRTINQIRLFADLAKTDSWKEINFELEEPNRKPFAKPVIQKERSANRYSCGYRSM